MNEFQEFGKGKRVLLTHCIIQEEQDPWRVTRFGSLCKYIFVIISTWRKMQKRNILREMCKLFTFPDPGSLLTKVFYDFLTQVHVRWFSSDFSFCAGIQHLLRPRSRFWFVFLSLNVLAKVLKSSNQMSILQNHGRAGQIIGKRDL